MVKSSVRATRVVVISDLHLGGTKRPMMSRPERLARFIDSLRDRFAADEALELVIAGDFVDFLATEAFEPLTVDPVEARKKFEAVAAKGSSFGPVFDALGRHVAGGDRLTVMIGNHDVEMVLPQVQDAFFRRIGATPHQARFVDDGRALQIGGLLVEHGNRYDGANQNDWTGLRAWRSEASRWEERHFQPKPSAGSQLVYSVINGIKSRYPFIDLLQPQGELVAALLTAFEPSLLTHVGYLARILHAEKLEASNKDGHAPTTKDQVAFEGGDDGDAEMREAFGDTYDQLRSGDVQVRATDIGRIAVAFTPDSLKNMLDEGRPIPKKRLQQIRVVLSRFVLHDKTDLITGPTGQYGAAAERILQKSGGRLETVVMGHTHLRRHIGPHERATYINTGTWADLLWTPRGALADGADEALTDFLKALHEDKRSPSPLGYADVRVEDESGRVTRAVVGNAYDD